jgi:hypothetical protein
MVTTSTIPALLAASAATARERAVLDAFAAVGANGPARPVRLAALPPLDPDVFAQLLERGAVREGAPGTFYRHVPALGGGAARARRDRLILFALIAFLVIHAVLIGRLIGAESP